MKVIEYLRNLLEQLIKQQRLSLKALQTIIERVKQLEKLCCIDAIKNLF